MKEFPLHRAAEEGDLEKLKHFIELDGMDVCLRDDGGRTPLHLAARCGQLEIAEYLIQKDGLKCIKDSWGATAMNLAAENGHKAIVDLLLKYGAYIYHCRGFSNWTVLHLASKRGWTETVEYIVKQCHSLFGTTQDLNMKTPLGATSLMLAANEGHVEIVKLLIEAGADINCSDNNSWTALHFASKRGWASIVENIVKNEECDLDAENSCGNTPLHIACGMNNTEIIQMLLQAGADSNVRNNKNDAAFINLSCQEVPIVRKLERGKWTALHIASKRGWEAMVQHIIESMKDKNDLDAKTSLGMTPLMLAAEEGHVEIVQFLIQAGTKINLSDDDSWTALHFASNRGWPSVVDTILKTTECDLNVKNSCGNTPLHIALNMNHLEVVKLLLKAGADGFIQNNYSFYSAIGFLMRHAARIGDLWSVNRLIDMGVSVDSPDHNTPASHYEKKCGCLNFQFYNKNNCDVSKLQIHNNGNTYPKVKNSYAPVLLAARFGHREVVDILLQCGAPVTYAEDYNYTFLHWAAHHGWADLVQHVIEKGELDINAVTCSGETPLMRATKRSEDAAAVLIQAGAEVNICDRNKGTALHFASEKGHVRTVQSLLERDGINLNPTDKDGNTPLNVACSSGQAEIVRMLLMAGAKTDYRNEIASRFGIELERLNIEKRSSSDAGNLPVKKTRFN